MIPPRLIVTGIGVISSIGCGREEFWRALEEWRVASDEWRVTSDHPTPDT
jgi:3-oxoacyl-(acyl-carrier-protein) synthase